MINRLICWLFGHRYKDWKIDPEFHISAIVQGRVHGYWTMKKPIGPCSRCGKE